MGLVKNSRYYNYTVNYNGRKKRHGFEYKDDYLTDLITNETLNFIEEHGYGNQQPFLIVLSYPAPHGPEDPAPQYNELFEGVDTHRTLSWNYARKLNK
jgi:extracellular sulfatase Sulf